MDDLQVGKSCISDERIVCLADKIEQEVSISSLVPPHDVVKVFGILDDFHAAAAISSICLLFAPNVFGDIDNPHQNQGRKYDQPVQY